MSNNYPSLHCNYCWEELGQGVVYLTKCSHIFCGDDAERHVTKELVCPVCETTLGARHSIHEVDLRPTDRKIIALCGLAPQLILEIASKAVEFWSYQQQTKLFFLEKKLKACDDEHQKREQGIKAQLVEVSNRINVLSHENTALRADLEREHKDLLEMQERYAEKVRQKRKLEELYKSSRVREQQHIDVDAPPRMVVPSSSSSSSSSSPGGGGFAGEEKAADRGGQERSTLRQRLMGQPSDARRFLLPAEQRTAASAAPRSVITEPDVSLRSPSSSVRALDRFAALRSASPRASPAARQQPESPVSRRTPMTSSSLIGRLPARPTTYSTSSEPSPPTAKLPTRPPTPTLARLSFSQLRR